MLRLIKRSIARLKSKSIKFSFLGKYGLQIKSQLNDEQLQEFLIMIYSHSLINDVINSLKITDEEQYVRVTKNIELMAQNGLAEAENEDEPIIGAGSENNSMGRS